MTKLTFHLGFVTLLFFNLSAFAIGWGRVGGVNKVNKPGVFTAEAEWLKDKTDKFDVSMRLTNDHEGTILLFVGDLKCSRGTHDGKIDIHSEKRAVDLRPKETRTVLITCHIGSKDKGDFSITMKVFSNPSSDSITPGPLLAEDMVWKQGENEGKKIK